MVPNDSLPTNPCSTSLQTAAIDSRESPGGHASRRRDWLTLARLDLLVLGGISAGKQHMAQCLINTTSKIIVFSRKKKELRLSSEHRTCINCCPAIFLQQLGFRQNSGIAHIHVCVE